MAELTCPQCGQLVQVADQASGSTSSCPQCQAVFALESASVPIADAAASVLVGSTDSVSPQGPVCAICQCAIRPDEARTACPECQAIYHAECWQENGGCGVYGCSQVPPTEQRRSIEIPVSYWGQENKPCPACGQQILAAAVRCRHCGATFASAQPEDTDAFKSREALEKRLPVLRQIVIWIFVLSILPCLAPVGGIWGVIWYAGHRQDLAALPPLYPALCKLAMVVGLGQTALMVVMGLLYSLTRVF